MFLLPGSAVKDTSVISVGTAVVVVVVGINDVVVVGITDVVVVVVAITDVVVVEVV